MMTGNFIEVHFHFVVQVMLVDDLTAITAVVLKVTVLIALSHPCNSRCYQAVILIVLFQL